jgi:hypothetical protein
MQQKKKRSTGLGKLLARKRQSGRLLSQDKLHAPLTQNPSGFEPGICIASPIAAAPEGFYRKDRPKCLALHYMLAV